MGRRTLLNADELATLLPPGWTGDTHQIRREWTFGSYAAGLDFAVRVAQAAEAADHHPDILLAYRRVRVTFWTHDAGGVTRMDMAGAQAVDLLACSSPLPTPPPPGPA